MPRGKLIRHIRLDKECSHDAPSLPYRIIKSIDVGSQWECGKCKKILTLSHTIFEDQWLELNDA